MNFRTSAEIPFPSLPIIIAFGKELALVNTAPLN